MKDKIEKYKLDNIDEIYRQYSVKRRKGNCFFSKTDIFLMWTEGRCDVYNYGDSMILINREDGHYALYYLCSDVIDIIGLLPLLAKHYCPLIINEVGRRREELERWKDFSEVELYKIYIRLRRGKNEKTSRMVTAANRVTYPKNDDLETIMSMIDLYFDRLVSHSPDMQELQEFVNMQQVLAVYEKDKIAGFLIYEDTGKNTYIRMLCVSREFRKKGYANELVKEYMRIHKESIYFTVWTNEENHAAIQLYESWGYQKEAMNNYIYMVK